MIDCEEIFYYKSATPKDEIIEYLKIRFDFDKITPIFQVNSTTKIELGESYNWQLSSISVLLTPVIFTGQEEIVFQLVKEFRREFLRAGG